MGKPRIVAPLATFVFAAFSKHDELLDCVPTLLADNIGPVALASERFEFVETAYYESSMGPGLKKQLFACQELQPADFLPKLKLQANAIEEQVARCGRFPEARPLNLDPGYVDLGKLVLASTKDHAHRLYLGSGIYGEVTLYLKKNEWTAWPWTYPDYKRPEVHAFLHEVRELHRQQLQRKSGEW